MRCGVSKSVKGGASEAEKSFLQMPFSGYLMLVWLTNVKRR
jgi:hypothetical protein